MVILVVIKLVVALEAVVVDVLVSIQLISVLSGVARDVCGNSFRLLKLLTLLVNDVILLIISSIRYVS